MRKFAITVVVVLALALGLSVYMNWLNFSMANHPGTETELKVTLDKEKLKDDWNKVKEEAKVIKEGVKDQVAVLTGVQTLQGTLQTVDVEHQEIKVGAADLKTWTVQVTPETKYFVGDKPVNLTDLKIGDRVTVTHTSKDGVHIGRTVKVIELVKNDF